MKTTIDTYPVFDANQVLRDDHLNRLVDYLDEQERSTRANLVGVGISCGLDAALDVPRGSVAVARGCAVTSLGYLMVEHEDVRLTGYREYELPDGDAYAPFMDGDEQLSLWQLFPDGEPGVAPLDDPADFLADKTVLLFLERNSEDLADCSPNNCDDKGAEITVTLRRLALRKADLARIVAQAPGADASARLTLPDLRLHRYDVPRTGPVTTRDVLEAFQALLKKDGLVTATKAALSAAYAAFEPILRRDHPADPFAGFESLYGFLEALPADTRQVVFLQHYVDLFSDLLGAYDEFRERALALTCVCCPTEDWFPRHVVLGPESRTAWYPASASCCGCEERRRDVGLLFTRLVELTRRFRNDPALRQSSRRTTTDEQIRITPSRSGRAPLSARCIPYYYDFAGDRPLYELWSPELTRLRRAHHNQAYRANEYSPAAPAFVQTPLSFELEPFDFLRIEGHLGKDHRTVVARLAVLRDSFRLPFDVVALRTGAVDEVLEVDPAEHACRFRDLESAYDVLRHELTCLVRKAVEALGSFELTRKDPRVPLAAFAHVPLSGGASILGGHFPEIASQLRFPSGTLGAAALVDARESLAYDMSLPGQSGSVNAALTAIKKLLYLTSLLAEDLEAVDWDAVERIVEQLKRMSDSIAAEDLDETETGLTWKELGRQLLAFVYACRLEGLRALRDEYRSRLRRIRELAYFDGYVREHPGIRHASGVPMGGTFVVVYHGRTDRDAARDDVYAAAIGRLAEGTVVADFCLPYRCCSDCTPVQFVLGATEAPPAEPPRLTAKLACTDSEGRARAEIAASGGTEPYALSIDGESVGSFPATLVTTLAVGTHTLQVTDADGVVGAPISVRVPEPLATGPISYVDSRPTATFDAVITVEGGSPPYTASAGILAEDEHGNTTVSLAGLQSDSRTEVTVTDSVGCTTLAVVEHEVPSGCDKPCDGKAKRSRYPVWIPPPGKTPYAIVLRGCKLEISDERGTSIFSADLTERVGTVLTEESTLTDANYASVLTKACRLISKLVADVLDRDYGTDAFVVGLDPESGTLLVESYACHSFLLELAFALEGEQLRRDEIWRYSREKVDVQHQARAGSSSYAVPAFGIIDMDKCADTVGKDCTVALRGITARASDNGVLLIPQFQDGTNVRGLAFHWRVDGAALVVSREPQVTVGAGRTQLVHVQLLVVDRGGCWAFWAGSIEPGRDTRIRARRRPR